jgi:hypothetical protein
VGGDADARLVAQVPKTRCVNRRGEEDEDRRNEGLHCVASLHFVNRDFISFGVKNQRQVLKNRQQRAKDKRQKAEKGWKAGEDKVLLLPWYSISSPHAKIPQ